MLGSHAASDLSGVLSCHLLIVEHAEDLDARKMVFGCSTSAFTQPK
jgi:hypothetical protein